MYEYNRIHIYSFDDIYETKKPERSNIKIRGKDCNQLYKEPPRERSLLEG